MYLARHELGSVVVIIYYDYVVVTICYHHYAYPYYAYRGLLARISLRDICFRDTDQPIDFRHRNTILLAGCV